MKNKYLTPNLIWSLFFFFFLPFSLKAQTKQQYSNLPNAIMSGMKLFGNPGPASVNWTKEGNKYSYTVNEEIHSMDPKTLTDELVFKNQGLNFPGTNNAFNYESFQWSHDSKHLVFKSNFRKIYRNSGISDYFVYDLEGKQLTQAAKDARTAELSPDGSKVGIERNGNMFVYNFATGKEQ